MASVHLLRGFLLPLKTVVVVVGVVVDVSKPALRARSLPTVRREWTPHVRAHEAEWKAGLSSVLERNKGGFGNDLSDRANTMELFLW